MNTKKTSNLIISEIITLDYISRKLRIIINIIIFSKSFLEGTLTTIHTYNVCVCVAPYSKL